MSSAAYTLQPGVITGAALQDVTAVGSGCGAGCSAGCDLAHARTAAASTGCLYLKLATPASGVAKPAKLKP